METAPSMIEQGSESNPARRGREYIETQSRILSQDPSTAMAKELWTALEDPTKSMFFVITLRDVARKPGYRESMKE